MEQKIEVTTCFSSLGRGQSTSLFALLLKFEDIYSEKNNMSIFSLLFKCKSILSIHIQQNMCLDSCCDSSRKKHGLTVFS